MASCGEESRVSVACATRAFLRARLAAPLSDLEGIVCACCVVAFFLGRSEATKDGRVDQIQTAESHTKAPRRRFPFLVVPTIADDVVVTRVLARALPQLGARDSHSRPLALRRQDVRRHRGDGVGGGWTRGAQRSRAVRPQRPRRGNGDFRARRDGHQDGWFRCQEHHETRPPRWCCVRQGRDQGR